MRGTVRQVGRLRPGSSWEPHSHHRQMHPADAASTLVTSGIDASHSAPTLWPRASSREQTCLRPVPSPPRLAILQEQRQSRPQPQHCHHDSDTFQQRQRQQQQQQHGRLHSADLGAAELPRLPLPCANRSIDAPMRTERISPALESLSGEVGRQPASS